MTPSDKPVAARPAMRAAFLVLGVVAGAAIGIAAMPYIFTTVPSELGRITMLLEALEGDPPPGLLVFGNSVAMAGVDTRRLRSNLGTKAGAINMSFPGETLAESFLFYQEIPQATKTLIYVVSPIVLEGVAPFNKTAPNAFRLSGFEPRTETIEVLEAAFPSSELRELRASDASARFEGRWIVRQLIDGGLRRFIRRDIDFDRGAKDLEFPTPYRERLSDEKFESNLRSLLRARPPGPFSPSLGHERLLKEMLVRARKDGRQFVVVLAPIHPRLREAWGDSFLSSVRSDFRALESQGAQIIDALELLGGDEFLDPLHPSLAGAERLTWLIAEKIRRS